MGGLHGIAQVIEKIICGNNIRDSKGIVSWIRMAGVFLFVNISWIFFRAENINTAITVIRDIFIGIINPYKYLQKTVSDLSIFGNNKKYCFVALIFVLLYAIVDYRKLNGKKINYISDLKTPIRWGIYIICMIIVMILANSGSSQFIYGDF